MTSTTSVLHDDAMTDQLLPPANWYADPDGSGRWRYWDGAAWTGVYLNETERGPGALRQYWEIARRWLFPVAVVALAVAAAAGAGWFGLGVAAVLLTAPQEDGRLHPIYSAALVGAIVVGVTVRSGWQQSLPLAACGLGLALAGFYRERLPRWLFLTVTAAAGAGFVVFWLAGWE